MSRGARSASAQRDPHRPGGAEPGRVGLGDVVGVGGDAGAGRLGVDPRPAGRRRAPRTPGPARPRPRRARSRPGPCPRDARRRSGSSLRLDSAIIWANAAIGSGWTAASVPPHTTTSARPSRIRSMPSAMASLPDAQADTGVCTPALAPIARPTFAAGALGISIGIASGETRRGPFSLSSVVVVTAGSARRRCRRPSRPPSRSGSTPSSAEPGVGPGLAGRDQGELAGAVEAAGLDPVEDLGGVDRDRGRDLGARAARPSPRSGADTPDVPGEQGGPGAWRTSPPTGVVVPSPVTTTRLALMQGPLRGERGR